MARTRLCVVIISALLVVCCVCARAQDEDDRFQQIRVPPSLQSSSQVTEAEFADDCTDGTMSCTTCMFVMERLRRNPNVMLGSVCREMMMRFPDSYPCCTRVAADANAAGEAVRKLLFDGCYQVEEYGGAKEWIRPCPPHIVCSQLLTGRQDGFCPVEKADKPFSSFF